MAKAGGRHQGLYRTWRTQPTPTIEKSIRSLREQIAVHRDKIAHPDNYISADVSPQQRDGLIHRYWPKEILNFEQQILVLEGILKERTHE